MPSDQQPELPPEKARRTVEELRRPLQSKGVALRFWTDCLSNSDRQQLGSLEAAYADGGIIGIWCRLRGVSETRAVVEVARCLGFIDADTEKKLLLATGEHSDDPEVNLELALERGARLIISEPLRQVFWQGEKIDIDWGNSPAVWEYFTTLCGQASKGLSIDAGDFSEHLEPDNHSKTKYRLTNRDEFPQDLAAFIVPERGGVQRLKLPRTDICILQ